MDLITVISKLPVDCFQCAVVSCPWSSNFQHKSESWTSVLEVSQLDEKKNTCGLLIWDDELLSGTRPIVDVTSRMAVTSRMSVEDEVESKEKKCNCVEVMEGIYDLKKDKWKKNLLVEKKKVEWLKWILVASWILFCVFYARK